MIFNCSVFCLVCQSGFSSRAANILPFTTLLLFLPYTEDRCSSKQCPFYSECTLDENGEAQCTCVQQCSLIFDPICASDGETYPNECVFKIAACALNGNLTQLHPGHCSEFHCLLYSISFFNFFLLHRLMCYSVHIFQLPKLCGVFLLFSALRFCMYVRFFPRHKCSYPSCHFLEIHFMIFHPKLLRSSSNVSRHVVLHSPTVPFSFSCMFQCIKDPCICLSY